MQISPTPPALLQVLWPLERPEPLNSQLWACALWGSSEPGRSLRWKDGRGNLEPWQSWERERNPGGSSSLEKPSNSGPYHPINLPSACSAWPLTDGNVVGPLAGNRRGLVSRIFQASWRWSGPRNRVPALFSARIQRAGLEESHDAQMPSSYRYDSMVSSNPHGKASFIVSVLRSYSSKPQKAASITRSEPSIHRNSETTKPADRISAMPNSLPSRTPYIRPGPVTSASVTCEPAADTAGEPA